MNLSPKQILVARKFYGHLVEFGRTLIPQMCRVDSPPMHHEIARELLDPNVRALNIIAPRGHAKSSLVACVYVLYHLMYDPGRKFIVLVSKTQDHAIRLLDTIKEVLESPVFKVVFGIWGVATARTWHQKQIVLKDGSVVLTRGTGQMVVGLKYGHQRPTRIIIDDPEDMNNTKTAERMEFNLRWLLQALYPAMDPQTGRMIVIGTPQHERCIVETLKGMQGWKTLHYSAIQEDGTALWPQWWSLEKLERERASFQSIGRVSIFYREYLCKVIATEEQIFPSEQAKYWEGHLMFHQGNSFLKIYKRWGTDHSKDPLIVPVNCFMGIDPASTVSERADFTAMVPIAYDNDGVRYVLPYFNKRVKPLDGAKEVVAMYDKYLPLKTRIESTGFQNMFREYVRTLRYIPGVEIKEVPRDKKIGEGSRIESLQPFYAEGKLLIQPGMRALEEQLWMYPHMKHDDLLDALFYACKRNFKPAHAWKTKEKYKRGEEVYYLTRDQIHMSEQKTWNRHEDFEEIRKKKRTRMILNKRFA
jgi:phage terminase large subunit-like protein